MVKKVNRVLKAPVAWKDPKVLKAQQDFQEKSVLLGPPDHVELRGKRVRKVLQGLRVRKVMTV